MACECGVKKQRLDVRAAAKFLGISYRTLMLAPFREKHKIPTLKCGKKRVFCPIELQAWQETHRERGL